VFLAFTVHLPAFSLLHSSIAVAFPAMYDLSAWRRSAESETGPAILLKAQIRPKTSVASPLEGTHPKADRKQKDTLLGRMDDALVSYMGTSPFHPFPLPQHAHSHAKEKFNLSSAPDVVSLQNNNACPRERKYAHPTRNGDYRYHPCGRADTGAKMMHNEKADQMI